MTSLETFISNYVREIIEAYDFDKTAYRGLHNRASVPDDEMSNDPDKHLIDKLPNYNVNLTAPMKKTQKMINTMPLRNRNAAEPRQPKFPVDKRFKV